MIHFPVDIRQEDSGMFKSRLVDVPEAPTGSGDSPASAYENLIRQAMQFLSGLMREGRLPPASEAHGRPTIGIEPPVSFDQASTFDELRQLDAWDDTAAITYSWRTNVTFRGG